MSTTSFSLTFLTPAEAPLSAEVDAAYTSYCAGYPESIKAPMLLLLTTDPAKFRNSYPLVLTRPR